VSYDAHIARAFRYAAQALVEHSRDGVDRETLASLHRDAAVLLTETGTVATGFHPNRRDGVRVAELARHPVRLMLNHLNTIAHPLNPDEDRPAPSQRWAGRPDHPAAVTDAVGAWKGLVVELLQARHALTDEVGLDRTLESVKVDRRGGARQRPWWSSSRPCALPPRDLRVNPVPPP